MDRDLDQDDGRIRSRPYFGEHSSHLVGLAPKRFGRGTREHDFSGERWLEIALGVRLAGFDSDLTAVQGGRRGLRELPVQGAAARNLND